MKIEIYQDARGEWRWRMKSRNGRIVADSGEGYKTKRSVHKAIARTKNTLAYQYVPVYEVKP